MEPIKTLSIRMPKSLWSFLKRQCIKKEEKLNRLIVETLEKLREKDKSVDN